MPAYIRAIVGERGKVIKLISDSLYHSNEQTMEYIEETIRYQGADFEYLSEGVEDAEVLLIFDMKSVPSHHPLDPIEYEDQIDIHQVITLQTKFKEYSWEQIQSQSKYYQGCVNPPEEIEQLIGDWEETYNEDFYSVNEDDPFCIYKHDWENTFLT